MSTKEFVAYPCSFIGGSTWNLRQVGSWNFRSNVQARDCVPSGATRRHASTTDYLAPVWSFNTTDILTCLTNTSLTAGFYASGGAEGYYSQRALGAAYQSGSNHVKLLSYRGLLVPTGIGASGTDPAQFTFDYHDLWDGDASHRTSTPANGSALGASTPTYVSEYYRGACTLNGTEILNVEAASFNPGLAVQKVPFSGEFAPSKASIPMAMGVFQIATADLYTFASLVGNSEGAAFTNLIMYIRRGQASAARQTGTTALSLTATAGHMFAEEISGPGNANAGLMLTFKPTVDVSVNTGATHPS